MPAFFKEPLIHFLLLGIGLFLLFQLVSDEGLFGEGQLEEIVISEGQVEVLLLGFEKIWNRLPSSQELDGLVDDYVREEIFYREAIAMGLDQNDSLVRRRLRQKLEFLSEDILPLPEPSDEELTAFMIENTESYRQQALFSFRQVYFNVSQRGVSAIEDAQALLESLQVEDIGAENAGDRLMVPHQFVSQSERDVSRTLGQQFLDSIKNIESGSWLGPVESGFGLHLVYLDRRADASAPELEKVRAEVLRDWTVIEREKQNAEFYEMLKQRYKVSMYVSANDESDAVTTLQTSVEVN